MMLRLQRYRNDLKVKWVPGRELYIADTLSRATHTTEKNDLEEEMEYAVHSMVRDLAVSEGRKQEIRAATQADPALCKLMKYIMTEFPSHKTLLDAEVRDLWNQRDQLHVADGILFCDDRILVPRSMRKTILDKLHESHIGIVKTKERARKLVFWPGMSRDIEEYILKCKVCQKYQPNNQKEPMIPHQIPNRAWKKLGCDLFEYDGKKYLLVIDYYSKYLEMSDMQDGSAETVVQELKAIFARHGIPQELVADNVPFNSASFKKFASDWDVKVTFSSPRYAQSNGMAESGVKIVKTILKKCNEDGNDPYVGLLNYRSTPIIGLGYSPAQLLFSRNLRTKFPATEGSLRPTLPRNVKDRLKQKQHKQKATYDRSARPLSQLNRGDKVRVRTAADKSWSSPVTVKAQVGPRSFAVGKHTTVIRNRRHLTGPLPEQVTSRNMHGSQRDELRKPKANGHVEDPVVTRHGRVIRRPDRYGVTKV